MVLFGFFPAKYSGMTLEEVMYDRKNCFTLVEALLEFKPDMEQNPFAHPFSRTHP